MALTADFTMFQDDETARIAAEIEAARVAEVVREAAEAQASRVAAAQAAVQKSTSLDLTRHL